MNADSSAQKNEQTKKSKSEFMKEAESSLQIRSFSPEQNLTRTENKEIAEDKVLDATKDERVILAKEDKSSALSSEETFQSPQIRRIKKQTNIPPIRRLKSDVKAKSKRNFERISDVSLTELTKVAQEVMPLPREIQNKINKTHRNWFIAQLRKVDTEEELVDFAYSLDHQQLSLLFPILATVNKKSTTDKIRTILSLRMSKVLYAHGWLTFQFIYPDNRFAKIMTTVCQDLEKTNFTFSTKENVVHSVEQKKKKILPYPHFNWKEIKLISEISLPDSRRFINNIVNYILDNQIDLQDFFQEYGIYDDLALGESIKSTYDIDKLERQISNINEERKPWKELLGF